MAPETKSLEDVLREVMRSKDIAVRQIQLGEFDTAAIEAGHIVVRLGDIVDAVLSILELETRAKPHKEARRWTVKNGYRVDLGSA